ncbi:hypothetical protein [Brevundimonas sp.]|nr:hypothetical protein [Brevundimonas sp.]
MITKSISRLVRLGAARKLTRAVDVGDYAELNTPLRYDIPSGE